MPTDEFRPLAPPPVRDFEELKDSEERLQAFMDHSPVLAFMKDDEGRYVYLNPKMASTFRVSLEEVRGKADFDWLPEDVARTVRENDRLVLTTRRVVESLESLATPEGIRHLMVVKFPFAKPDGRVFVGGVAVDVTSLHVTRERLAKSESRYRHLVESSQGLICTHDLQGRLLSVNPAALELLGYTAADLVGRDMRELLAPAVRTEFDRYLERINANLTDTGLMLVVGQDGREHVWQYHNVKIDESGEDPVRAGSRAGRHRASRGAGTVAAAVVDRRTDRTPQPARLLHTRRAAAAKDCGVGIGHRVERRLRRCRRTEARQRRVRARRGIGNDHGCGGCADQYVSRRRHRRPDRRRRVRRACSRAAGRAGRHSRADAASPGRVQRAQRTAGTR